MRFDFLLCSERSGSNLLTQMLDSHSTICGPFPSHLMLRVGRHLHRYGDLADDGRWSTLLGDVADYLAAMHSEWRTTVSLSQLEQGVPERTFGAILRFVYETEATAWNKSRVFLKDNHAYSSFGFVEASFPDPVWVLLVRDPRDMAAVWKANSMEAGGVRAAAECWKADQAASLEMVGQLRPLGRIVTVRFEDLITTPEAQLERVCAALGIDFEPGMLGFHEKPLLKTNANNLTSWTDLQKPIDPTNQGFFRQQLSEDEIRYVEARCEEEMVAFGYPPEHAPAGSLTDLEAALPPEPPSVPAHDTEAAIFARWYDVRDRIAGRRMW